MVLTVLVSALSLLALLSGCKSTGSVTVRLDLPQAPELNPMDDPRLASFSLIVTDAEGNIEKINTVPYLPAVQRLEIGEVPVGHAGRLTLIGYSAANKVLAYGEAASIEVDPWESLTLSMALRKPYTYISGGPTVAVFDTTLAHAADVVAGIDIASLGQVTTAVATSPDGRYLLAAVADSPDTVPASPAKLLIFDTGSHARAHTVPLAHDPDYLSVSADGHWAILSATDASMITVVDMQAVFAGTDPETTTRDIVFAAPKRAAFVQDPTGRDLAVILRDQLGITERCDAAPVPSTLSVIDLADGTLLNSTALTTAAADIASQPGDNRVFVAQPCQGRVATFDTSTFEESTLVSAQVPTSLIVKNDTLWVGSLDESADGGTTAARIVISSVDLKHPPPVLNSVVATPFLQEGYVLRDDDQLSSKVVLRANPRSTRVYHLSVPPGSTRVSALVFATYYGDYRSDPITVGDDPISEVEYFSFSYVGLDTTSGEIRRRYRGYCIAIIDRVTDDWYCCEDLEQHEGAVCNVDQFIPTGATSLYGVP